MRAVSYLSHDWDVRDGYTCLHRRQGGSPETEQSRHHLCILVSEKTWPTSPGGCRNRHGMRLPCPAEYARLSIPLGSPLLVVVPGAIMCVCTKYRICMSALCVSCPMNQSEPPYPQQGTQNGSVNTIPRAWLSKTWEIAPYDDVGDGSWKSV